MADYDLVVIGGTPAGLAAAIAAAGFQARVALVEQGNPLDPEPPLLQALSYGTQQLELVNQLGIADWPTNSPGSARQSLTAWLQQTSLTPLPCPAAAGLAGLGVDVIAGKGEFQRQPRLGFAVEGRTLRSRAYLLAPDAEAIVPEIPGLAESTYLTPDPFCRQLLQTSPERPWPQRVIVIGGDPSGIVLAQVLTRLGVQVTIAVGSHHILPKEDPDAAALIQAQLEAEGVRILTRSRATQVRQIQAHQWVQAGDFALESDALILAAGQQLGLTDLNLEAVGVRRQAHGLELNSRLQTSHPRIYACQGAIAGYLTPQIARYEAELAVRNTLFLPLRRADYRGMPWATLTQPELVRIGLTEPQARQRYGSRLQVLRQSYKMNRQAQIAGTTTGFCKLLATPQGKLVGAHLVGAGARELAATLSLAMRQGLRVGAIATLPYLTPTLGEILQSTAQAWEGQRQAQQRDWLEGWLNFSRGWFN